MRTVPIPFVVAWVAVWAGWSTFSLWLGSKKSGWRDLANLHAMDSPFEGRMWHFRIGLLLRSSPAWHYMLLNVGANRQGLYLKMFPISLPFYPQLFIPWSDVSAEISAYWLEGLEIRFHDQNGLKLELRGRSAREIVSEAGEEWLAAQLL